MLGKTNAVSASGGGSGDIVQAVNRTGKLIHSGEKVWIAPQTQQKGNGFQFYGGAMAYSRFLTDNDCNYIRYGTGLYFLGNDDLEPISSEYNYFYDDFIYYNYGDSASALQYSPYKINILTNGEVIMPEYNGKSADYPIPSNSLTMIYWFSDYDKTIYSYNKETRETKKYTNTDNLSSIYSRQSFIIDNILYTVGSDWYAKIDENSASFSKIGSLSVKGYAREIYPLGITNDKKITGYYPSRGVMFAEIQNENELYIFTPEEVGELKECYFDTTSNIYPMFFPDSQIITYIKYQNSGSEFTYGVFKYSGNNKWQKLNVVLPIEPPTNLEYVPTQYCQYLAISTDLSKCIIGYWNSSSMFMLYRYQLENSDVNNIYKYRREINTENWLTGFANQDIPNGQTGEVSTTLKAHVSYPEPEPEPGTEQYEINQDTQGGIVFVGDLQTVAGPYGNTVAQITDTTRLTLGNDGANIFAGMFADTQTADCFRIKFKMPRKGISSGGTWYALSDSLSQNVENPTDGCVRFGFTASWDEQNSEIDSQVVSFVMERYSSEQGWETLTEVIMPDFKLNTWYDVMYYYGKYADWEIEENGNSGYRLFINVYNEGGELIGRELYDNYPNGSIVSTENVQIGYPIYATSYFYIDVDLSQTGFQLLDSWVWRPVKEV